MIKTEPGKGGGSGDYIPTAEKGAASGVATLDASQILTLSQSPLTSLSTCLLVGGELSVNSDTTIDISAGAALFVDNTTDPLHPTRLLVTWEAKINVTDPLIAAGANTYVGIDSTGVVHFWGDDYYTAEERRDYVVLGWTDHIDGLTITDVYMEPMWGGDVYAQLMDFLISFGAFNIGGNEVIYSPTELLSVYKGEGTAFCYSDNYPTTKKSPHIITSPSEDAPDIYYCYRTSLTEWYNSLIPVTVIDPNNWDNNAVFEEVPDNYWTIQLITFYPPWGIIDIQYGQKVYDSKLAAKAGIVESISINPYNAADVLRAWLVVQKGCIDLSDIDTAEFVSAGRLGLMATAGGGGSGGSLTDAQNVGLSGEGLFEIKSGIYLNFKNIDVAVPLQISSNAASSVVHISMPQVNSTQNGFFGSNDFQNITSHSHGAIALTNILGTSSSNGLSLSISNQSAQTGISGIAGSAASTVTAGTVQFANSNGVSFGLNGSTMTASYTVPTQTYQPIAFSGSNASSTASTISFGNSNGLSHYITNGSVVASYTVPTQSQQPMYFSASGTATSANTIPFGNSNGISFSLSNGSIIGTVKTDYQSSNANYLTSQSNQAISFTSGSVAFQTLSFTNSNGISFNSSTQGIFASHNAITSQSNQTGSIINAVSLSGTNTSGVLANISSGTMYIAAINNITISQNANSLTLSGPTVGGAQTGISGIAGSAASTVTVGTVQFANANGVSFGLNGSTMTASITSQTNYVFSNSNSISFGTNASTVTASFSQMNQAISGSNASSTFQTISFGSSNGMHFYMTNGSIVGSYTAAGGADGGNTLAVNASTLVSNQLAVFSNSNNVSFGVNASTITASASYSQSTAPSGIAGSAASTVTNGIVVFSNLNNVSFGLNGSTMTASVHAQQTAISGIAGSAASTVTAGTVVFSNLNGVSFGLNGSTMTASITSQTNYVFSNSNNVSFGTNASTVTATVTFAQSNQTMNIYVVGSTTGASSSSSYDARTLSLYGSGNIYVGNSNGSVVIMQTGGAGGDGYNSAQFAASTANSTMPILWAGNSNGSGNITLGLTGSTVTGSAAGGAGGGATLSGFEPFHLANPITTTYLPSIGTWYIQPFVAPQAIASGRLQILCSFTNSSAGICRLSSGNSFVSNSIGTRSISYIRSHNVALFSRGAGANSTRLESFWSTNWSLGIMNSVSVIVTNVSNPRVSATCQITWINNIDASGGVTTSSYSNSGSGSSTGASMATSALSSLFSSIYNRLSGQVQIAIPFATSINPGQYWLGQMWSTASTTGGTSVQDICGLVNKAGIYGLSSMPYRLYGQTVSNTSSQIWPGAGIYSVSSASPPSTMNFTMIRSFGSHVTQYFNWNNISY